jgi:predicted kinase
LPGSGKTTDAKKWVAEDYGNRVRVNRDDIRGMFHDGIFIEGVTENRVIDARNILIKNYLRRGVSVACDDTNLKNSVVKQLMKTAYQVGAAVDVVDLTNVSVDRCISRDYERGASVGAEVITQMAEKFVKGKGYPLPLPLVEPVEAVNWKPVDGINITKPWVILCDIDGTLAHKGDRDVYDDSKVHLDTADESVLSTISSMADAGYLTIFVTGRSDACRPQTEKWLRDVGVWDYDPQLLMRKAGDTRDDAVVKYEIFDREIRDNCNVLFVLDDRDRVVEMWRRIGLKVYQVAPGDF